MIPVSMEHAEEADFVTVRHNNRWPVSLARALHGVPPDSPAYRFRERFQDHTMLSPTNIPAAHCLSKICQQL